MIRLPRRLAIWGGAAAVAVGGFAFMASNSVGASYAGEGSHAVSGYTVYDITYSGVTSTNSGGTVQWSQASALPSGLTGDGVVTAVSFRLTPDNALWSHVRLFDSSHNALGGSGTGNCHESGGVWTCAVTGVASYPGGTGVPLSRIALVDVEATH